MTTTSTFGTTTITARDAIDYTRLATVYLGVVANWATDAQEIAQTLGALKTKKDLKPLGGVAPTAAEVNAMLKRLAKADLVVAEHINGERKLTWQSYHDINNEEGAEEAAKADFEARVILPEGDTPVRLGRAPGGRGATGPAYTAEQIAQGIELRRSGESWMKIAQAVGVKSQVYFSTVVRKHNGGEDPKGQPAPEPVATETKKPRRTVRRSAKK
jgi:hypothetical protein